MAGEEYYYLLGCDAVQSGTNTFRRNVLPLCSSLKRKPSTSKKSCLHLAGYLLGLFFDPENGGSTLIRNVRELLSDYTASHTIRQDLYSSRGENIKSNRNQCQASINLKVAFRVFLACLAKVLEFRQKWADVVPSWTER
jgi:hypothetical protein